MKDLIAKNISALQQLLGSDAPCIETLSQFVGWGSMKPLFNDPAYAEEREQVKNLLDQVDDQAFLNAQMSTDWAHYTPREVSVRIWKMVQALGFDGGRILDPGCGTGNFSRACPKEIAEKSEFVGVEQDPVSAVIAERITKMKVFNMSFRDFKHPDGYFDLAIGNPPYGKIGLSDPRYDHLNPSLHEYFLAKSIDLVRPGGLICFVTSPYQLNRSKTKFLEAIGGRLIRDRNKDGSQKTTLAGNPIARLHGAKVQLIDALWLPLGIFSEYNTEVSPVVVLFQRLEDRDHEVMETGDGAICGLGGSGEDSMILHHVMDKDNDCQFLWQQTSKYRRGDGEGHVNHIFAHPGCFYRYQEIISSSNTGGNILGGTGRDLVVNPLYGKGWALKTDDIKTSLMEWDNILEVYTSYYQRQHYKPISHQEGIIPLPSELQSIPENTFVIYQCSPYQVRHNSLHLAPERVTVSGTIITQLHDLIGEYIYIADTVKRIMELDRQGLDYPAGNLRKKLETAYSEFWRKWRFAGGKKASCAFSDRKGWIFNLLASDPRYHLLELLETEVGEGGKKKTWIKSKFFISSPCRKEPPPVVEHTGDAVVRSFYDRGCLDIEYIAELTGYDPDTIGNDLYQDGAAYYCPHHQKWIEANTYLSGNIWQKIKQVEGWDDPRAPFNLGALKASLPKPSIVDAPGTKDDQLKAISDHAPNRFDYSWYEMLSPSDRQEFLQSLPILKPAMNSSWMPPEILREFAHDVMGIKCMPVLVASTTTSAWDVKGELDSSLDGTYNWGGGAYWHEFVDEHPKSRPFFLEWKSEYQDPRTGHIHVKWNFHSPWKMLEIALNGKDPQYGVSLYDTRGEHNLEAERSLSESLKHKSRKIVRQLKNEWEHWLLRPENAKFLNKMAVIFNTTFNVFKRQKFDGAILKMPGLIEDFEPRPYQRNAIMRILSNRSTFLAHQVGAGKTATAVISAMEAKRMGQVGKPCFVALNSTVQQIYREWMRLYPNANVIVIPTEKGERERMLKAIAVDASVDGIIMPHSVFEKICLDSRYQKLYLEQILDELQDLLSTLSETGDKVQYRSVKNKIKTVKSHWDKVVQAIATGTPQLGWQDLAIDMVIIDEIHLLAKNVPVISSEKDNVRGITSLSFGANGQPKSKRSITTMQKILYTLDQLYWSEGVEKKACKVVGMTGTVISNTITELFAWMSMFGNELLRDLGILSFDSWANNFAQLVTKTELGLTQKYATTNRLSKFHNLRMMFDILSQFMDIVVKEDLASVPLPEIKTVAIGSNLSTMQKAFVKEVKLRADLIKAKSVAPKDDNILKICGDANKASIYMGLIGKSETIKNPITGEMVTSVSYEHDTDPGAKIHKAIATIYKVWEVSRPIRGVCLVFLDTGTPKPGVFNMYDYCKSALVQLGVPSEEIEFAQDRKKDKPVFHEEVNNRQKRIVFGSTQVMGTGCNLQLGGIVATVNIDAPWTPDGLTQRLGRMERHGNGSRLIPHKENYHLPYVFNFRFVTKSLDAHRWQTLSAKIAMINQFLKGKVDEMVNIDEQENPQEVISLLTMTASSKKVEERLILQEEFDELRRQFKTLSFEKDKAKQELGINEALIQSRLMSLKAIESDIARLEGMGIMDSYKQFADTFNERNRLFRETEAYQHWKQECDRIEKENAGLAAYKKKQKPSKPKCENITPISTPFWIEINHTLGGKIRVDECGGGVIMSKSDLEKLELSKTLATLYTSIGSHAPSAYRLDLKWGDQSTGLILTLIDRIGFTLHSVESNYTYLPQVIFTEAEMATRDGETLGKKSKRATISSRRASLTFEEIFYVLAHGIKGYKDAILAEIQEREETNKKHRAKLAQEFTELSRIQFLELKIEELTQQINDQANFDLDLIEGTDESTTADPESGEAQEMFNDIKSTLDAVCPPSTVAAIRDRMSWIYQECPDNTEEDPYLEAEWLWVDEMQSLISQVLSDLKA